MSHSQKFYPLKISLYTVCTYVTYFHPCPLPTLSTSISPSLPSYLPPSSLPHHFPTSPSSPRSERCGPTMLVLSPTRELALQIEDEVKKYSYKGIKCVCIYGGGDRRSQINIVVQGVEIVIGECAVCRL